MKHQRTLLKFYGTDKKICSAIIEKCNSALHQNQLKIEHSGFIFVNKISFTIKHGEEDCKHNHLYDLDWDCLLNPKKHK